MEEKTTYERPTIEIKEATLNSDEAYSAAAVPAAAPAVQPVATVGAAVGSAAFSKFCW